MNPLPSAIPLPPLFLLFFSPSSGLPHSRPDIKGRKEIFDRYLKGLNLRGKAEEFSGRLAGLTPGFAGADIENLCNEAAIVAARRSKKQIDITDFEVLYAPYNPRLMIVRMTFRGMVYNIPRYSTVGNIHFLSCSPSRPVPSPLRDELRYQSSGTNHAGFK